MPPPPAKKFAFASSQASSATANNLDGEGGPPIPLGRVVPKVVTIARPPRMLKVEHLTDPKRGIASLPRELTEGGHPFKGKGHELEDLRLLLSRAKHWAHRLFPRITFEDFVERAEGLGSKRPLRNHLTRIRHGMPLSFGTTNEEGEVVGVNSEDEEDVIRAGDDNQGPAMDSSAVAAAAEQEDNNSSSSSTSELKFDRLFREFSSTIAAASSSTQRPPPPPRLTTTIEKVAEDEEGEEDEEKKEKEEEEEKVAQKAAEEGSVSEEITAGPPAQSQQLQQQQQSSTSKQQQQEEEEFDMDDDDFDEDFLSSFKP